MKNGQTNLVDETTARLVRRIVQGEWEVDARIPTERELASSEDVARSTLRSAVERLQSWGMLESKQGSGTRVLPPIRWRIGAIPSILQVLVEHEEWDTVARMLLDALSLRRHLVLDMLRRAAPWTAGQTFPNAVEATHAAWEKRNDPQEFLRRDHFVLAHVMQAAGMDATLALINEIRRTYEAGILLLSVEFDVPRSYVPDHLETLAALRESDGERAAETFAQYLDSLDAALATALPEPLAERLVAKLGEMA